MLAQTKVDVRSTAAKPTAAAKPGPQDEVIVDNRELLDHQAAAAAVVDAEQSDAAALQVTAEGGIVPTAAPIHSIGELAQAPATTETTTDTATDTTAATTTPAPEAAAAESPAMSPWAIGGIALLGVAGIAAAASSGSDSSPTPAPGPTPTPTPEQPAPVPPPVEPPAPAANVAPTSADAAITLDADNQTALSAANFAFSGPEADQTLASVTIGAVTATVTPSDTLAYDAATGHASQFVSTTAPISWEVANKAAIAAGGHLMVVDDVSELSLVRDAFATTQPNGLGDSGGSTGTWIGLTQQDGATNPGDNWAWTSVKGEAGQGAAFPGDSALWNAGEPNDNNGTETGQDQWGALYQGTTPTDTALIFDYDGDVPNYIIEFESALTLNGAAVTAGQVVAAADLGNLSWNSVFNDGGTVAFQVTDSGSPSLTSATPNTLTFSTAAAPITFDGGAGQSVSTLIEDYHLNVLA